MIRFLILLFAVQVFISCGSSSSDDSLQKQSHEDNERRKAAYNRIKGVYEGILQPRLSNDRKIQIQMVLYTYDLIEPTPDPNGDPVIRTVLLGQFRAPNTIGEIDDINLVSAYDIKTGHITLNNAPIKRNTCPVGPSYTISIDGDFVNGTFQGSIRREAVTWGSFVLKPSGVTVAEPITDQAIRIEKFLGPLTGEYLGKFQAVNSNENFKTKIQLRIENVQMDFGEGFIYCPDLRGTYSRPDFGTDAGTLAIRGVYNHGENRIQLESITSGGNVSPKFSPIQGYNNLKIDADVSKTTNPDGTFQINGFAGNMNWWKYMGHIEMKKQ